VTLETSDDAVLGGRLRLRQPLRGHRVGHDAMLLAAFTPAQAGQHVADFGAGIGGAGLALARRVDGVRVTLVEIDPELASLAAHNAAANDLAERVRAVCADVGDVAALSGAGLTPASLDGVLMNPPFNDARRQNVSPDPRRRLAHVADPGLLGRWVDGAARLLKRDGTLTVIWRAEALADVLEALERDFGAIAVLPVFPRPGATAIRVLVRAVQGAARGRREYAGLVLNDETGRPSVAAETVLRGGEALVLAEP